ncbi:MAG: 50S ribosomal protein L6 [Candidatus Omnitrophica bacterium]|nr:50S ribosomal protein L6 [Candidatus Omnitrophota bacterium]MDD5610865.1 50S ribosomal protein L6 [Candidatus Omnitrophota bacterium]
MSRIGKKPIDIPDKVKVEIKDSTVFVEGPKGKLSQGLPVSIIAEIKEGKVSLKRTSELKKDKSLHGLMRTLILNMIKGVTTGYTKELEVVGVGFKAQMQGKNLNMTLGFTHPVIFTSPEGIQITTPKQTQIVINGIDKELVGRTASIIRDVYPPEPYKGKGIRYAGEFVRKKVGKAAATK